MSLGIRKRIQNCQFRHRVWQPVVQISLSPRVETGTQRHVKMSLRTTIYNPSSPIADHPVNDLVGLLVIINVKNGEERRLRIPVQQNNGDSLLRKFRVIFIHADIIINIEENDSVGFRKVRRTRLRAVELEKLVARSFGGFGRRLNDDIPVPGRVDTGTVDEKFQGSAFSTSGDRGPGTRTSFHQLVLGKTGDGLPLLHLAVPKLPSVVQLQGEYLVNESVPANGQTEWRIGWNREFLFFEVRVKDSAIFCDSSIIYNEDSIEFFIPSEPALPVYREIIVNPDGKLFDAWHVSAPVCQWGFFQLKSRDEKDSLLKPETIRTGEGYRIILRVPWKELPGYTKGNAPQEGDEIRIMLIRTEKRESAGNALQYAMYPVVAGGHNLRTMAVCRLTK